jgi:hypothetical protein
MPQKNKDFKINIEGVNPEDSESTKDLTFAQREQEAIDTFFGEKDAFVAQQLSRDTNEEVKETLTGDNTLEETLCKLEKMGKLEMSSNKDLLIKALKYLAKLGINIKVDGKSLFPNNPFNVDLTYANLNDFLRKGASAILSLGLLTPTNAFALKVGQKSVVNEAVRGASSTGIEWKKIFITLIVLGVTGYAAEQLVKKMKRKKIETAAQKSDSLDSKPQYSYIGNYFEEFAVVEKIVDGKQRMGLIDQNRQEVVATKYDHVDRMYDGIAPIRNNGKWGFISKTQNGIRICEPKYDERVLWEKNESLVPVISNIKYGLVNRNGEQIGEVRYDKITWKNNQWEATLNGKKGHLNDVGNFYADLSPAEPVSRQLDPLGAPVATSRQPSAAASYSGQGQREEQATPAGAARWRQRHPDPSPEAGAVNWRKRHPLQSPQASEHANFTYVDIDPNENGLRMVYATENGRETFGFVNEKGEIVIPLIYDTAHNFHKNLAAVKLNGKYGFIDKTGKFIISPKYDTVYFVGEEFAVVSIGNYKGFVNLDERKEVVPPTKYNDVRAFHKNLAAVQQNGKWGFVNKEGVEVVPPKYDDIDYFSNGFAKVQEGGKWGVIDEQGGHVEWENSPTQSAPPLPVQEALPESTEVIKKSFGLNVYNTETEGEDKIGEIILYESGKVEVKLAGPDATINNVIALREAETTPEELEFLESASKGPIACSKKLKERLEESFRKNYVINKDSSPYSLATLLKDSEEEEEAQEKAPTPASSEASSAPRELQLPPQHKLTNAEINDLLYGTPEPAPTPDPVQHLTNAEINDFLNGTPGSTPTPAPAQRQESVETIHRTFKLTIIDPIESDEPVELGNIILYESGKIEIKGDKAKLDEYLSRPHLVISQKEREFLTSAYSGPTKCAPKLKKALVESTYCEYTIGGTPSLKDLLEEA